MPDWIKRMIKMYGKLGILDFCIDCGCFIMTPGEHKTGIDKDHVVVRMVTQGEKYDLTPKGGEKWPCA